MLIAKKHTFKQMFIGVKSINEYLFILSKLRELGYVWRSGCSLSNVKKALYPYNYMIIITNSGGKFFVIRSIQYLTKTEIQSINDTHKFLKNNFEYVNT